MAWQFGDFTVGFGLAGYDPGGTRRVMTGQTPPGAEPSADRRTALAAERTYAAWVRTGLTALAAGVGARQVLGTVLPGWALLATGTVLVLFGGFCFTAAVWRELWTGAAPPHPDVHRLPGWLLIAVNGFLVLVCLGALAGLWSVGRP